MDDLISRQVAIDALGDAHFKNYGTAILVIKDLPSAEPKKGRWIWKGEEGYSRFMCSVCQWKEYVPTCNGIPDIWQYCPSCGARMEE